MELRHSGLSWPALPFTIRAWAVLIVVGWLLVVVAQQGPSVGNVVVSALIWYGVAIGKRWVWIVQVVSIGLGMVLAVVVLFIAPEVLPEVLDGVPTWLLWLSPVFFMAHFACVFAKPTRDHVQLNRADLSGGSGPGTTWGGGGDDGARGRQGMP